MTPRALLEALRFLTALPLGGGAHAGGPSAALPSAAPAHDPSAATAAFPLAGLAIGALLLPLILLPLPAAPRAALVLLAWTLVTGALHEDGWTDCMDAAFAPVDVDRRHAILKDPRVGAHGLAGMVGLAIVRFAALVAVAPAAVVAAPVVGRWAMVLSLARFRPARSDGLGAAYAGSPRLGAATAILVAILAGIGALAGWGRAALSLALGAAAGLAVGAFLAARFGGLTGDGHGAVGLAAETAALYAWIEGA